MTMGARFAKWGLGFFVFGLFLTFGIIGHYCVGASADAGELFRRNVTLWWACPWTLSVAIVQGGGLGMVALGLTLLLSTGRANGRSAGDGLAFWLCIIGLLGVFAVGYPGYFAFNKIWPNFYYVPNITGKNAWLFGQTFFFAVYFTGVILAFNTVRHALDDIPRQRFGT
ncbi:hypothetical protein I6F36_08245 [Bradyrhizobium sp. BRP19]|uniref:hypothetical protein n=1 Tax=Bradyrhizobium sp. BRP19 TaxID=2793823 RepID=UPI001CD1B631|nr:hypothetical protein [Bradyrhizobium sp. BRP19]MCA1546797.1 hypothetical protein [Bradyrhizobium sp. BRP19]